MFRPFVLAVSFVAMATVASAAPLTFSMAGGEWKNATAPAGVCVDHDNQTGTLHDEIRWGGGYLKDVAPDLFPPYSNLGDGCWLDSYVVDGVEYQYNNFSLVSGYDFAPFDEYVYTGTPAAFSLGTFKHLNFPVFDGITSVEYNFQVAHTGSSLGSPFSFHLLFEHNETDNTNYPVCCDDIVTVSAPGPAVVVEFGAEQFVLEFLGFSGTGLPGSYARTLSSPEDNGADMQLFARITPLQPEAELQAAVVPEPATLTLFGTGLAAVALAMRRRRRR